MTRSLPQFSTLAAFDHQSPTRLVFGVDSLRRLGALVTELGIENVLLVTDPGIVNAGHADTARKILQNAGIQTAVFSRVCENPTTDCVEDCLGVAREAGIEGFVALGGGSSIDTAKGCNFLLTNGGEMKDYWGVGKAAKPMLPLVAIPTTAGTGSECQSAALIADAQSHQKMACLDPKAAARISILDPALTLSQPQNVTACTGVDAIAHVVETAVTKKRNGFSLMCSHEAAKLTIPSLPRIFADPQDLEARGRMLLGAAFAGMAIENSMLGAAHAAANPLTAHFDIVHGQAVGLMLPHVVSWNAQDPSIAQAYAELASATEIACLEDGVDEAAAALVEHLNLLLDHAGMPRRLSQCAVTKESIPQLAEEAAKQWTGNFNPRPVTAKDFAALYQNAF